MAGKTGESGDICGRNLKMSTTMEIMTIESNAYRLLVEKIEKITAYVEESRNREETERKRKEEAESHFPAAERHPKRGESGPSECGASSVRDEKCAVR